MRYRRAPSHHRRQLFLRRHRQGPRRAQHGRSPEAQARVGDRTRGHAGIGAAVPLPVRARCDRAPGDRRDRTGRTAPGRRRGGAARRSTAHLRRAHLRLYRGRRRGAGHRRCRAPRATAAVAQVHRGRGDRRRARRDRRLDQRLAVRLSGRRGGRPQGDPAHLARVAAALLRLQPRAPSRVDRADGDALAGELVVQGARSRPRCRRDRRPDCRPRAARLAPVHLPGDEGLLSRRRTTRRGSSATRSNAATSSPPTRPSGRVRSRRARAALAANGRPPPPTSALYDFGTTAASARNAAT